MLKPCNTALLSSTLPSQGRAGEGFLGAGQGYQHLQYMPFGETFVSQRLNTWGTPYQFSVKEKDAETGYSYFGARYYDPNVSVWLSVDPLSDKYPSMSAFMYCAGNPVMLVDPDGKKFQLPPKVMAIIANKIMQAINQYAKSRAEYDYRFRYEMHSDNTIPDESQYIKDNPITTDFSGLVKQKKSGENYRFPSF